MKPVPGIRPRIEPSSEPCSDCERETLTVNGAPVCRTTLARYVALYGREGASPELLAAIQRVESQGCVFSPEFEVPAYGMNPPEWGSDIVEVEAASKRDALLLGVKEMERQRMRWVRDNRWDGKPPWAGIKVEEASR